MCPREFELLVGIQLLFYLLLLKFDLRKINYNYLKKNVLLFLVLDFENIILKRNLIYNAIEMSDLYN